MGWFDTETDGIMYSDETLDLVFNFLKEFSLAYQNDLKRKPSVEELQYILSLSFRVNADSDFISDFDEKRIEDVKFKIGRRKKKIKYEVGDMCAIPLPSGGYAFARIMILTPPSWYLGEVFAYFSEDKVYRPEIEESGQLFTPMFITPNDYNTWNSIVIDKNPDYKSPLHDKLLYYYGIPGNYKLVKIGENKGVHISDEEVVQYQKKVFYHPLDTIKIIEEELKKKGLR